RLPQRGAPFPAGPRAPRPRRRLPAPFRPVPCSLRVSSPPAQHSSHWDHLPPLTQKIKQAPAIEVIDADLGLSGRTASHRDGFKHLVARVCLGEVGAVFGLEVSRLARSNADLARLLELARLTDTLVIDNDGVYDLSDINDRLLLGLKSQMSEAELHW